MATGIVARTETLIPANLSEQIPMFSWPDSLQRSVKALTLGFTMEVESGRPVKRAVAVIPRQFSLSPDQRREVERRIEGLRAIGELCDQDFSMMAVAKLLLAKPSAALSEAGAEARAQAYMVSLGDLPTFAVREAVRKWLRAGVRQVNGHPVNFEFAPSGETLRVIAEPIIAKLYTDIGLLERLLRARIAEELTPIADVNDRLRQIGEYLAESQPAPTVQGSPKTRLAGGHASRVMEELAQRRERRERGSLP